MTRRTKMIAAAGLAVVLAIGAVTVARAQQSGAIATAIAAGSVGEQADGYLGIRDTVAAAVRAEVEAINIKRRAGYTTLAEQRAVTVKDVAATVGCRTLATRVGQGESYLLRDGVWRTRDGAAPIVLPDYCG
ncbi:MAG: DUF1318 domain-containing protein [Sphingomonadaceae bacterium]